ncbi:LacI family transcriptional regulator [Georgenia sp. TF02-10]|uniref:LacI family DNA-binding transcriptional regulator n=1 Tax=Georgenia sp. TF02-10 TaxID=2917725 RepID=UPI001FA7D969|nr:LacI family DNA-binding transcriptional regulator [Georgenia sp. TF02-10]UNX54466.1 LacI family transcriptional regulator [Georgenia sp. TF02-10]
MGPDPVRRARPPSMADVAAVAGVSHQTVSRVLNNPELVRPDTRERVTEAMRRLGYRRNLAARALVTRRTGLIGVVNPGDSRFGPSSMTIAAEEAARAAGYATTLAIMRDGQAADATLEHFRQLRVDGVVVVAPVTEVAAGAKELSQELPVVLVAAGLTGTSAFRVVTVDQAAGARMATRHLLEHGHTEIVHVAGPSSWYDARARMVGYRAEMHAAGLEVPPLVSGGWDPADGHRVARQLLADGRPPRAIFAANDLMALGILRALHEAGVRVPEDVSVVGFDDISGAAYYEPPLTTVRQPFADVGREAIAVLLGMIAGTETSDAMLLPRLVPRASVAPPG